ncbi:PH domain-containing protein [Amniculibacterium aquaticum]|uniref:PH domain-containing protein n=1 Tax=Amniculibacterium aquaticum TaxID=2479858 RepID=UPI001F15673F|nr:PH domain-containing protein [Amniculibacterium aquaticum]
MDRIKIPVKTGWFPYAITLVLTSVVAYDAIISQSWIVGLVGAIVLLFFVVTIFSIHYEMDEDYLYIYSYFRVYKKVEIRRVYKIEKTWNLISSPAPSITGRVEIYWNGYNSVVISPKNFEDFKTELLKRNPDIVVKE